MSAVVPEDIVPQPLPWAERAWQRCLSIGLGMLGFFLLFSTAGTAFSMFWLMLLVLAAPVRVWKAIPWREPVFATGLALFAYIALRGVAETGLHKITAHNANHYHELLMLPLVYGVMRCARRPQPFVNGLLLAVLTLAVLSWMAPFSADATEFMLRRRISASFGMAVCTFLLVEHTRAGHLKRNVGYTAAAFLALTVLFTVQGRTGQLILLVLAGCASWRGLQGRWRLPLTLACVLAVVAVATLSAPVRERLAETRDAIEAAEQGRSDDSSTGGRIEILYNALGVARDHWLVGVGWDHYPGALQQEAARRHRKPQDVYGAESVNPHDEFLLQLGAGGVMSLLLFITWLAAPLQRAWRQRQVDDGWASAAACVALAFAIAAVFNSVLLDWVEAHFYVSVLAWLLARRVRD